MTLRRVHLLMILAFGCILFGASAITTNAGAEAATHCFAASCNGVDPYVGGCANDARTIANNATNGTSVLLRYSNTCNAAWVKIVDDDGCFDNPLGTVQNSAGARYTVADDLCDEGPEGIDSMYSVMVSDTTGQTAFACLHESGLPYWVPGVADICTNHV